MQRIAIAFAVLAMADGARAEQGSDIGIKISEKSRLHLGGDIGTGFDTNPNFIPMADKSAKFSGDFTLALRPRIDLDVPGELVALNAGAHLNFQNYFGAFNKATGKLRQLDGDVGANLEVNRGGLLGFQLRDRLTRAVDPGPASLGTRLARFRNDFGTGLEVRPGSGTLSLLLTYDFGLELFDARPAGKSQTQLETMSDTDFFSQIGLYEPANLIQNPSAFNNMTHKLQLRGEWRFLPKTGFFANIFGGTYRYLGTSSSLANNPVGIEAGAMGQLTSKISGLAKLGYTNPLVFDNKGKLTTASFLGITGQLEARFAITELNVIAAGFRRIVKPVYMYNFFTENRFYLETQHQFFGKLSLRASGGYNLMAFDKQAVTATGTEIVGGGDRLDHIVDAGASITYHFLPWLSAGLTDTFMLNLTNAQQKASAGVPAQSFSLWKNLTLATVTAYY